MLTRICERLSDYEKAYAFLSAKECNGLHRNPFVAHSLNMAMNNLILTAAHKSKTLFLHSRQIGTAAIAALLASSEKDRLERD
jgi:hypothetical protein